MNESPELPLVFWSPSPLVSLPSSCWFGQLSLSVASAIAITLPAARTPGSWVRNERIWVIVVPHDGAWWLSHSQPKLPLINLPCPTSVSVSSQNTASDGANAPVLQLEAAGSWRFAASS